jgi:hypothetical protein
MKCIRILLWVTKSGRTEVSEQVEPAAIVFAYAPSCFPGVKFPSSSDDREGIKESVEFLHEAFKNSPLLGEGQQKVSTFSIQKHLFLDVTVSGQMGPEADPSHIHAAVLLTPMKDCWLVWILMSNTDAGLRELKKLKVKFADADH